MNGNSDDDNTWEGLTTAQLKQEQAKLEGKVKSAKDSRLLSIQDQLESKLAQLKQFMRQQLPDGQRYLSIQSHLRRIAKQREHLESKQQEYQRLLQDTEEKLLTTQQEEQDLHKQLLEAKAIMAADTELDSPDSQPARMKAAVSHAASALDKQVLALENKT